jgi:hypothetical protein
MPYVTCPDCHVINYAPLSYRQRGARCPSCEELLGAQVSGTRARPIVLPSHASQDLALGREDGAHSAGERPKPA